MKTLHLSLKKLPFDVMNTGEKDKEFRKPSKWITSRLFNKDGTRKHYDVVKCTNGYGDHRPLFVAEYNGFEILASGIQKHTYSNGFTIDVVAGDIIIKLGKVLVYSEAFKPINQLLLELSSK